MTFSGLLSEVESLWSVFGRTMTRSRCSQRSFCLLGGEEPTQQGRKRTVGAFPSLLAGNDGPGHKTELSW